MAMDTSILVDQRTQERNPGREDRQRPSKPLDRLRGEPVSGTLLEVTRFFFGE